MSSVNVRIKIDTSYMDMLDKALPSRVESAVQQAAEDVVKRIKKNWSKVSPSAAGDPPAYVTGFLEDSIKIGKYRDRLGQFSNTKNATQVRVVVEAEYAAALEFGHVYNNGRVLAARPYLRPAIMWMEDGYAEYFKNIFYFDAGINRDYEKEWSFYDRWEDNGEFVFSGGAG